MIPGSNLLSSAFALINTQNVKYYKAGGRTLNELGNYVSTYVLSGEVRASIQSANKSIKKEDGTYTQVENITVFVEKDAVDIARGTGGDRLGIFGNTYQIQNVNNWFAMDSWSECLCVQVKEGDL